LQGSGGVIKLMHRFRGFCSGGGVAIFIIVVVNLPLGGILKPKPKRLQPERWSKKVRGTHPTLVD